MVSEETGEVRKNLTLSDVLRRVMDQQAELWARGHRGQHEVVLDTETWCSIRATYFDRADPRGAAFGIQLRASVPLNVVDSTATGDKTGGDRKLEFYPSDESENPQPGNPTVEVFDKAMGPADLMGEILSHHLPRVDPRVADFRQKIIGSMTPDQIKGIRGDYENEQRSGITDGESFDAWLNRQGGDSFFRGYPTGQWDAKEYTPAQLAIYSKLQSYLNNLPVQMGGAMSK